MANMLFVEIFLIAISLSMDAFSLSISISASNLYKTRAILFAIVVGIFHFFMPIFGYLLKQIINYIIIIPSNFIFICIIIFIILGILIDDNKLSSKILNPFIFAFTVSIDSFSIGISIESSTLLISCMIFSLTSFFFTIFGFILGKVINNSLHKYSKIVAISILLIALLIKLIQV